MIVFNEPPSGERNHRLSRDLTFVPAAELARINGVRMPGESADYRQARDALVADESELRPAVPQNL